MHWPRALLCASYEGGARAGAAGGRGLGEQRGISMAITGQTGVWDLGGGGEGTSLSCGAAGSGNKPATASAAPALPSQVLALCWTLHMEPLTYCLSLADCAPGGRVHTLTPRPVAGALLRKRGSGLGGEATRVRQSRSCSRSQRCLRPPVLTLPAWASGPCAACARDPRAPAPASGHLVLGVF